MDGSREGACQGVVPPFWQAGSLSNKCPVSPRHFPCRGDPVGSGGVEGDDLNPNEAMEEGTEEKVEEEESEEMKTMSSPPVPILPSREEVLKHRLTHRPFRNWCPPLYQGEE